MRISRSTRRKRTLTFTNRILSNRGDQVKQQSSNPSTRPGALMAIMAVVLFIAFVGGTMLYIGSFLGKPAETHAQAK